MLTTERHNAILQALQEKQNMTIQELTDITASSASTIRRDLTELEQQNKLERIHGGATLSHQKRQEFSLTEKSTKHLQEKMNVAKYAASFINDGDCIFLDAGTTVLQLVPFLAGKDITVVTNGLSHLDKLKQADILTYLIGGRIKTKTAAIVGSQAVEHLTHYHYDCCFLGVNGIHDAYGYTTPDPEEAAIKQTASQTAKQTFVLSDHSKFHKVSFAKVLPLNQAVILTSPQPSTTLQSFRELTAVKEAPL